MRWILDDIVVDATRHRILFLLLILAGAACTDLQRPEGIVVDRVVAGAAHPAVTAATPYNGGVELWFSQAMNQSNTAGAITVHRLTDHVLAQLSGQSESVDHSLQWLNGRQVRVSWLQTPGSYVIEITTSATSVSEFGLDGLAGKGQTAGIHRPDNDWMDVPARYITQALHIGGDVPVYQSLPANAYLTVTDISAWQSDGANSPASTLFGSLWSYAMSRVNRFAPIDQQLAYRIQFSSPAGGRYRFPTPADAARFMAVYNKDGARLGQANINMSARLSTPIPIGYTVQDGFGLNVTVSAVPNAAIATTRNPQDRLWLFLGESASPRVISAEVLGWNVATETFTLSDMARPVSGSIHGTTVATDRRWWDGELDGGYALKLPGGPLLSIATATGSTLYLENATSSTDCSGCDVVLTNPSARVNPGDTALMTSETWYFLFDTRPPTGLEQFFSINASNLLRSFPGTPFRDIERDGDETTDPPEADDEFVLAVAFRSPSSPNPPFSRLNDALLYPTAFDSAGLACLGSHDETICATTVADEQCPERTVPARAHFSFYTADGSDGDFGTSDLVERESIDQSSVQVFAAGGDVVLDTLLETRVIIHTTDSGTFSTSLLTIELFHPASDACGSGASGRRGFQAGDRIVISHNIRAISGVDPRTIDGNHDGIAQASPEDDWVGIWNDERMTFVPLVRYPRR